MSKQVKQSSQISKEEVNDQTQPRPTLVIPTNNQGNINGSDTNATSIATINITERKPNEDFFYSGHYIVKLWEQYLKAADPTITFYSLTKANANISKTDTDVDASNVATSIFNGLTQNKEIAIVIKQDGTPYQNKDGKTITLCGEINYTGADQATELSLSSSLHSHSSSSSHSSSNCSSSNYSGSSINTRIQGAIHETIEQIKSYNSNISNLTKITNHIVIFPYHAGPVHWNLGQIELRFQAEDKATALLEASINIYEPFGGQTFVCRELIESINLLEAFSKVKINQQKIDQLPHIKQQHDSSSCGAITAENGKEFLKGISHVNIDLTSNYTTNLLKTAYPSGATQLRVAHINEINDEAFFIAQRDNISHEAKGDKPIENQAELQRQLEIIISKQENDWIKQVIYLIQLTKDDVTSRTSLNLFKEFLIRLDLSDTANTKISSSLLKTNGNFREGTIDLIKTVSLTTITYSHNSGAREKKLPNIDTQKSEYNSSIQNLNKKIQEARTSLEKVVLTKTVVDSTTNITILKQIEDIIYKPLIHQLAYKKSLEELKALAVLLQDLGYLTKQIGELSGDLKYYTDSAVLYQYAITIIKERIDPKHTDKPYNKQIEELYRELAVIKEKIISLSKSTVSSSDTLISDSSITDLTIEATNASVETKENQSIKTAIDANKKILDDLREYASKFIRVIEIARKESGKTDDLIKKQKYENLYVSKSKALFEEIASKMKGFLACLYQESEQEIGILPPCTYTVIGLGSMALNQMTPYSDLEFAILTQNEDYKQSPDPKISQYFMNLTHLVHFKMIGLGETIIPTSKYNLDLSHLVHKAVNFDLGGKTPLGRIDKDKPYELIQTVEKMLCDLRNEDNKTSNRDKTLPYILEKACYVHGDQKLISDYQVLVTEFLHSKINKDDPVSMLHCEVRAMKILKEGVTELDYLKPDKPETLVQGNIDTLKPLRGDEGKLFDVKQEIYRLADRLIHDLGMYYGIEGYSAWDTVDQLENQKIIETAEANHLKYAVTFATTLRLKTYLHHKGQIEDISLFTSPASDPKVLKKEEAQIFHLLEEDLGEQGGLFRYFYTALPFHKILQAFCSNYKTLNNEQKQSYFKTTKFYAEDSSNKGLIHFRLLQYKQAQTNLEDAVQNIENAGRLDIRSILNNIYVSFGQGDKAIKQSLDCITLLKNSTQELTPNHHKDIANYYFSIGETYRRMSNYDEAIKYFELSLSEDKDDLHTANVYNSMGLLQNNKGNYNESIILFNKSLVIKQTAYYKEPHLDIAISLTNLGETYRALAMYNEAIEYFNRSLDITKHCYKNEPHLYIAITLGSLGSLYQNLDKYEKAIDYYIQSLNMRKLIFNNEPHPTIVRTLNNLGIVYKALGHYDEANKRYNESQEMQKLLQNSAPNTATYALLSNKGAVCKEKGQYDKAIQFYKQSLSIQKDIYKDVHPDIANILNNIGEVYRTKGQYNEAMKYHTQCLEMRKIIYKDQPKHPDIAASLINLSAIYNAQDKYDQAIKSCDESLKILHHVHKEMPHLEATALNNIAESYRFKKEYDKAIDYQTQCLDMERKIYPITKCPKGHPDIAQSLKNIAYSYRDKGWYRTAIKYFLQSQEMMSKLPYSNSQAQGDINDNLELLYLFSGIENSILLQLEKLKISLHCDGDVTVKINTLGLGNGALTHYCEFHLGLNSRDLRFATKTCQISLNKKSIAILRDKVSSQNHDGQGTREYEDPSYWNQYSKEGIKELLKLRLDSTKAEITQTVNTIIPDHTWYDSSTYTIEKLTNDIISSLNTQSKALVCLNLYGKHWVGLAIDKSDKVIKLDYMDSEQNQMPILLKEKLAEILSITYQDKQVVITETKLELQKSNNCGPEVIENFILYPFNMKVLVLSSESYH